MSNNILSEEIEYNQSSKFYSEEQFWKKIGRISLKMGKKLILLSLKLFYAAKEKSTPTWARTIIYSSLGYFIMPVDAIPDFIPLSGYSDDLGVLVAAVATVAYYIDDAVEKKAQESYQNWFGRLS